MKIYTKTGDTGETSLFGGQRVKKSCLEIDAIGEVDELNGAIGVLVAVLSEKEVVVAKQPLETIQHRLFTVGANIAGVQMDLGTEFPHLTVRDVEVLEAWIDRMESELPRLTQFILPGGSVAAAQSFLARAVCRRAERRIVDVQALYPRLDPLVPQYVNRLSDAFFVLSRFLNKTTGVAEVVWRKEG